MKPFSFLINAFINICIGSLISFQVCSAELNSKASYLNVSYNNSGQPYQHSREEFNNAEVGVRRLQSERRWIRDDDPLERN